MDFPTSRLVALEPLLYDMDQIRGIYGEAGQEVVNRVTRLVTTQVQPPFAIAIDGAWGAGKTTFLSLIRDRLDSLNYPTVWFNPWEYDATGEVVLALQKRIASELIARWKFAVKELGVFALALATAGISVAAKKCGIEYEQVKALEEDVREALDAREWSRYEDHVEATKSDFIRLTREVGKRNENGQGRPLPVVIFLDDLDRCLPDNALKLLEAVKNQFIAKKGDDAANAIFICGLDTATAKRFIMKKYEGIGHDFAFNYFRKIFNLTLGLPPKPRGEFRKFIARYVHTLFNGQMKQDEADCIASHIETLSDLAGTTSVRLMLNVANDYFVCQQMANTTPAYKTILNLLFLREYWNEFFGELVARLQKKGDSRFVDAYKEARLPELAADQERLKMFTSAIVPEISAQVAELHNAGLLSR